jgi:uncharacterized protein YkwD
VFGAVLVVVALSCASCMAQPPEHEPHSATRVNQFTAELQKSCVRNLLVSESREYLYPPDSDVDPNMPDHRVRPEMRGPDGQIYPATDFVRTNDGLWVNAVTGQSPQNLVGEPKLTNIASASHRSTPSCGAPASFGKQTSSSNFGPDGDALIAAINSVRTNPKAYADDLIRGSQADVVLEAAAFLRRQEPLPPLHIDGRLEKSAERHVADQGPTGSHSHVGTDGSTVRDRVEQAGVYAPRVGEEIAFDAISAEGVVRQLIVDDGVPDRGHRKTLFNDRIVSAGAACGPHAKYNVICVIDIAGSSTGDRGAS